MRTLWKPMYRGDLASAACGGQWTQARKAAVTRFGIDDNRCQLCLNSVGTLEHRFCCETTRPEGGWPPPPPAASLALTSLSEQRQSMVFWFSRLPPRPLSLTVLSVGLSPCLITSLAAAASRGIATAPSWTAVGVPSGVRALGWLLSRLRVTWLPMGLGGHPLGATLRRRPRRGPCSLC